MNVSSLMSVLSFPLFRHVCVRHILFDGFDDYLGGGAPADIVRRFGNYNVVRADFIENLFIIYVN